jgi:hypothetical protein
MLAMAITHLKTVIDECAVMAEWGKKKKFGANLVKRHSVL